MKCRAVLLAEVGRGVNEAQVRGKLEKGYMSNSFNTVPACVVTIGGGFGGIFATMKSPAVSSGSWGNVHEPSDDWQWERFEYRKRRVATDLQMSTVLK